jgi:Membrane bound O-acyl transferase family
MTTQAPASRRRIPGRYLAAWAVIFLGMLACVPARDHLSLGNFYLLCGFTLFSTSKAATLIRLDRNSRKRLSWKRLLAYFFWCGLKVEPFLKDGNAGRPPRHSLWLTGLMNLTIGGVFLWVVPHLLPEETPQRLRLILGMVGYAYWIIFGTMDLWAAVYRLCGIAVEKQFDNPARAESLADFWGQRWNRIFSDFARDLFFRPLSGPVGAGIASFCVFLFAGVLHEWAWSYPARGGYGGPMLFFLIQWFALRLEGTRKGRALLRGTVLGRVWTWLVVLGPSPLLLHGPMLDNVALENLRSMHVPGLTAP